MANLRTDRRRFLTSSAALLLSGVARAADPRPGNDDQGRTRVAVVGTGPAVRT